MLSFFKPTLSRRWLIFILLAVLLPLCLFGWWSMESINTLLNSEARRTLNANGHLLQMMIEQSQADQRNLSLQTLRYLNANYGKIEAGPLLASFFPSADGWQANLARTDQKDGAFCYFERQSAQPDPLKLWSCCRATVGGWQLTSRKPFALAALVPAVDTHLHLQLAHASADLPSRSLSLPLQGAGGEAEGVLVLSETSDLMTRIRERRRFWGGLFFAGALVFALYLAKKFKEEIIKPVQAISDVAEQVSLGDLTTRLAETAGYAPMRKTARQFNQMLDQLSEKQQLQDNFVANLTHDLQTPLLAQERAFELFSQEFKQYDLPHLEALSQGLVKNNRHLLAMIGELLETYQFDAGKLTLHMVPLSVVKILEDCLQQLRPLADQNHISMRVVAPDAEVTCTGDERALHRIFLNIIGNAIANIPKSSTIDIAVDRIDTGVNVVIRDNGPGLSEEQQLHLFDRFYGGVTKKRKIGSGLGLYICKMLVDAHGGTIAVDSALGSHTTITVSLPGQRSS